MTDPLPPVSVVVCTRNRPRLLRETLQSLLEADDVPDEIVIVDQSDRIATGLDQLARGRDCAIVHVPAAPRGLGEARNEGVARARHDVLVFVDDDMLAHPHWLSALLRALVQAEPRTVVTGAVVPTPPERWRGYTPSIQSHEPDAIFAGRLDRDVLAGGHMAVERSALAEVGGFDPRLGAGARYPAADDNDLGFRLLECGYRIAYVGGSVLYHRAWRPGWTYPLGRLRYGRGKGGFYAKHLRTTQGHMRRRAARDVSLRLRRFPGLLLRQPLRAVGDVFYVGGVFFGGASWLLRERAG